MKRAATVVGVAVLVVAALALRSKLEDQAAYSARSRTMVDIECRDVHAVQPGQLIRTAVTVTPSGIVRCEGVDWRVSWQSAPLASQVARRVVLSGVVRSTGDVAVVDAIGLNAAR